MQERGGDIKIVGCVIFLILGVFSFGYVISIVSYSGSGTAFLWFWLILGSFSSLLSILLWYMNYKRLSLPRPITITFISMLVLGISVFIMIQGFLISYGLNKPSKSADYMIVLGAQVRGRTLSRALKNRLDTAYDYWVDNKETVVIVSGGRGPGEDITEAKAMYDYLVSKGIDSTKVIKEDKSTNTNENIRYSKTFIDDPLANILIVTNDFHVFRAVHIGKKQGFHSISGLGAPSDDILFINYYVREFFAVLKDKLVGNI